MSYKLRAINIFPFLAATFLFVTTGCLKTEIPIAPPPGTPPTTPPTTPPPSGTFSATVGGTAWTAKYYTAFYYQGQGLYQFTGVADGTSGDSTYLEVTFRPPFQLNQPINTNSGPLDFSYSDLQYKFDWDAGNSSGAGVCYLTITAYDSANHTIAGSFYGSMNDVVINNAPYSDTINVKSGVFNVTYTLQP